MKMIDNKGRVFGKINLFDLIVILLILVGIVAVIFRGNAPVKEDPEDKTENATYTFTVSGVQENVANAFKKGDEIYENGKLLGVLSKAPKVEPYQTIELMPDGTEKVVDHKLLFTATLTLETEDFSIRKGYRINGNEMLIGTGHVISNGFVSHNAVITDIELEGSASE